MDVASCQPSGAQDREVAARFLENFCGSFLKFQFKFQSITYPILAGRYSSVGIATRYGLDSPGPRTPVRTSYFS